MKKSEDKATRRDVIKIEVKDRLEYEESTERTFVRKLTHPEVQAATVIQRSGATHFEVNALIAELSDQVAAVCCCALKIDQPTGALRSEN